VQLGGDAGAVGIGFGGGQALAQLDNFFLCGYGAGESPAGGWVLTFSPPEAIWESLWCSKPWGFHKVHLQPH